MSWHTVAYKYINTDTVMKDVKNNVNAHYSEENNCKTELSVQYIFFYMTMYCTMIQAESFFCFASYMIELLSARCITSPIVLVT